ncbi:hypothetical protein SAMN02927916_1227 [Flavobacterium anhuiense]|uniref:Uncharacterized protein n=1 Tax=Flavobacterium anhuiense TaxID=459526 RepID=A0ABY0LGH4_9FLAO|nr:hypothetical protein [Flavobacterium anhuiense]SCY13623.1 hypothetical protein SAMN02927916_1227 [Flavobacterium anhuiense]
MILIICATNGKGLLVFLSDFFDVKKETVFTVLITLFVFCAGTSINLLLGYFKNIRLRNNYKHTINLLLYDLAEVCRKQNFASMSDIEKLSILDGKIVAVKQMIYAPLQFLNKMDYSLFIKYYVRSCNKKKKIKAATKLFQIIGQANIFESDNQEKINMYMNVIKPLQETYIKHMLYLEVFGETIQILEISDYDFKNDLINVYSFWKVKHVDNGFRNSFTNLVSPLIDVVNKYPMESVAINLISILKECKFAYNEIAHIDIQLKEYFKIFAFSNKNVYRTIGVILCILNDKKKKEDVFRRF